MGILSNGDFVFDNSLMVDYFSCKVGCLARHLFDRVGLELSLYGDLGNVGHKALERHFGGMEKEDVLRMAELDYNKIIPPGEVPDLPIMAKRNVISILDYYMTTHTLEDLPFEVLELEKNVVLKICPGLQFSMKRDMLVRENQGGFIFPVDHKFRWGKVTGWWTGKFKTNSQISGYIWGTKRIDGKKYGEEVFLNQLLLNVISMDVPQSNRKCPVHKTPYSECKMLHSDIRFIPFTRTEQQLNQWFATLIPKAFEAKELFQKVKRIEDLRTIPTDGAFTGGCTFCEFQKWCRTGFNPDLMETLTNEKKWRPWDELLF